MLPFWSMRLPWLWLLVPLYAQVDAPPEFQSGGKFQKDSATAVDGTSHASPEQTAVHAALLARLRQLPGHEGGALLLDAKLPGAAADWFRTRGLPIGVAVSQFHRGRGEESAAILLRLPRDLTVLPFLGEMALSAPAVAAIREIANANPDNAEAQYYLARGLLRQPGYSLSEVVRLLEKAANLDLRDTRALLELGRVHTAEGQSAAAVAALVSALARDPDLAAAHYRLASLYRARSEPEKARAHAEAFNRLRHRRP